MVKYIQVDVKGFKYHVKRMYELNDRDTVELHHGYIAKNELIYKHNYKEIVAIFQRKDNKKHGYHCTLMTYYNGPCIHCIAQYDEGVRTSEATRSALGNKYIDGRLCTKYEKGYLSHWLHDMPPVPQLH
jgi:hypothetical protein